MRHVVGIAERKAPTLSRKRASYEILGRKEMYEQNVGGHIVRGAWKSIANQSKPVRNEYNGKAYWGGAAIGFGSTIYRNWDVIRPVAAGIVGGVGGFMAGGPGAKLRAAC